MTTKAFQITPHENLRLDTNQSTLDAQTQKLPQGFYTTFCTLAQGTKVLGLKDHLQRLYGPAQNLGLRPAVDEKTLRAAIAGLTQRYRRKESRIRLLMAKESGAIYAAIQPYEPLAVATLEMGVHVTTTELVRKDPRIKDSAFIRASRSHRSRAGKGVFEVLLTRNHRILEGMTSNFYGIKGRSIITARAGILLGVTRKVVIRLARKGGMSIQYRAPSIDEHLSESFLTSSSRGVVPIIAIDGRPVGQGRVGKWTKLLSKVYQAYLEEQSELILRSD